MKPLDYIKLSRKILDWEWYSDKNTSRLFIHMLIKTNWKTGRFQGVEIQRGSFASSYKKLASETGLTEREVRTALNHLISTGEVTVNRHPKFSVFTIKNYIKYQSSDTLNDSQVTENRQSSDSQSTTIEEGKKERKEEYINTSSDEEVSRSDQSDEKIFATIRELYNSVCGSYPRLVKMSDKRKKAIRARLNTGYTVDDFRKVFEIAEASDFLKGKNKRDWSADFDWLICDSNMAKVLEGKYRDRKADKQEESYESASSVRLW